MKRDGDARDGSDSTPPGGDRQGDDRPPNEPDSTDDQPSGEPAPADPTVEMRETAEDASNGPDQDVKDLQEQTEEHEAQEASKFATLPGVFTPTLLTILGVIMFLRLGWVVGNAGLGGAVLIILLSFAITGATGLSMSTFVTNIRVGPGGAFSMISQSLGLEAGGAIGAPLYLSQALAELLDDICAGRKLLKIYRQMKMYNDPTLNPYLYRSRRLVG